MKVVRSAVFLALAAFAFAGDARPIRPLNGLCNTIPMKGDVNEKRFGRLQELYRALEIPETRFHDVVAENPGIELVDVSRIFPLFHADENDPRNYNFGLTDLYLERARTFGGALEFRFGEQIEHQQVQFQVRPPADVEKWARICLNIARHYNSGWADGFRWGIRRFSVWEEPDNDRLLTDATKGIYESVYFRMYASLARKLKAEWPEAHMGGPNTMGPYEKFAKFVRFCADEGLPLDFAAYTCYLRDPVQFAETARQARKILDDAGFGGTELEVAEWHVAPPTWDFSDPRYKTSLRGADSTAYAGAVLTLMQDEPVNRLFFYAAHVGNWAMFEGSEPRPVYYVFRTFAELRHGERLEVPAHPEKGVYQLAARTADGGGLMLVSLMDGSCGERSLALPAGLEAVEVRAIVDAREPQPVGGWRNECGRLILTVPAGSASYRVRLAKPCATASAAGLDISFRMVLGNPDDTNLAHRVTVTAAEMRTVSETTNATGVVTRRWTGHRLLGADFIAEATLTPAADGSVGYAFSYRNNSSALQVERIGFPDVAFARTDDLRIFYPCQQGRIRWPQWENLKPGATVVLHYPQGFHFIAAFEPTGEGVYVDQREGARLEATEVAALQGDGERTVRLVSWYDLPVSPETTRSCRLPFVGTVRRFRGGWFEACSIYRDWVRTQPFYKAAARRPRGQLADVAMWFWNRGRSEKVIAPVEKFRDDAGVPVALDWYWWHKISYDTDFPHFWPPREPEADFRTGVARCRRGGIYVQPYVNGMTWDYDNPTWGEGGAQGTVVERDGRVRKYLFNRFTKHSLAYMCGEAPDYQAHMRKTIRTLAGCGFNGVYMDMINNAGCGSCWNAAHRHPRGGGTHMAENFRRYVSAVRADNPGLQLSSEDGCEAYLELFDSVISLYANGERLAGAVAPRDEFVPGFNAIFHDCVTSFGTFAMIDGIPAWDETWPAEERWTEERPWERMFPDQFAVEISRGPTWGIQPCVHNFLLEHATDPRFAEDYRFMIETARFWHRNRPWLLEGEMLSPGKLTCPTQRVEFMRRSTYAKKGEFATCVQEALPTVFHSVWRAPDGRIAAVFVNWSRTARKYGLETPDLTTSGELPARSWRIVVR